MTQSAPLVSVVIPCFNAQGFVAEAIRSVLSQTLADVEVIVVDDASTDDSRSVIEAEAQRDTRVVPRFLTSNAGPAAARNRGLSAARGEWIALLDADDLYRPDRLERLLQIARDRGADMVADNQTIRDLGHSADDRPAFDYLKPGEIVHADRLFFFGHIWEGGGRYPMGLLKPMFRRAFIEQHNIAYDPRYRLGEDFLFYLECMLAGARFYLTGDEHYIYRHHSDSLSHARSGAFLALASMCDEILRTRRDVLDAESVDRLKHRRDETRKLGRNLQLKEIKGLRHQGNLGGVASYVLRNPAAAIHMVKASVLWRLRQRRTPQASR
jgi:succinoglycan biosynthesis protein ExoO